MNVEVLADGDAVAKLAAAFIAKDARDAVAERGRFVMAVSGGRTPWQMLRDLADLPLPWDRIHVRPPGWSAIPGLHDSLACSLPALEFDHR